MTAIIEYQKQSLLTVIRNVNKITLGWLSFHQQTENLDSITYDKFHSELDMSIVLGEIPEIERNKITCLENYFTHFVFAY